MHRPVVQFDIWNSPGGLPVTDPNRGGTGRPGDASIPYSDHADFNDLIGYVQAVNPQRVFTVFGFPDLAEGLRSMGYHATHLGPNAAPEDLSYQMPLL